MASKEAILLVLDIGLSSSKHLLVNGSTFFEMSKKCVSRIIERKVFSAPKDEIALVLLGTNDSNNELGYNHISVEFSLSCPSWNMLRKLEDIHATSVENVDWIDAIVVAMDIIQSQLTKKFTSKKIVLFTNLDSDVKSDDLHRIIDGMQKLHIDLTAIGVDLCLKDEPDDSAVHNSNAMEVNEKNGKSNKEQSKVILKDLLDKTDGLWCTFQDALPQLLLHQAKAVKAVPWKVCLDIGPDIRIPVCGYKKTSELPPSSWKTGSARIDTPVTDVQSQRSSATAVQNRPDQSNPISAGTEVSYFKEDQTSVTREELILAYQFGSSLVPFTESDAETMIHKSNDKCLSILGFTQRSDVPRHLLSGKGVYYFVAPKDCPEAQPAFSSLVESLHCQNKVAIVRKIYRNNTNATLGALFSLVKDDFQCLVYVDLPYSGDVNEYIFPQVMTDKLSSEELEIVGTFIDNMDLMNVNQDPEESEALNPEYILSPVLAHTYHSLAHRALHPSEPLPPVDDSIKSLLECPFKEDNSYKVALEAVKSKFELIVQESDLPKRKKKSDVLNNVGDSDQMESSTVIVSDISELIKDDVVEVGTRKPEDDFLTLLKKGESFAEVCRQMQRVILNLVIRSLGSHDNLKAHSALKLMRQMCTEKDSTIYNDWISSFKTNLYGRGREEFWEIVVKDGLGLISSEENSASTVSPKEAADFMKTTQQVPLEMEMEIDADDLLNEM